MWIAYLSACCFNVLRDRSDLCRSSSQKINPNSSCKKHLKKIRRRRCVERRRNGDVTFTHSNVGNPLASSGRDDSIALCSSGRAIGVCVVAAEVIGQPRGNSPSKGTTWAKDTARRTTTAVTVLCDTVNKTFGGGYTLQYCTGIISVNRERRRRRRRGLMLRRIFKILLYPTYSYGTWHVSYEYSFKPYTTAAVPSQTGCWVRELPYPTCIESRCSLGCCDGCR